MLASSAPRLNFERAKEMKFSSEFARLCSELQNELDWIRVELSLPTRKQREWIRNGQEHRIAPIALNKMLDSASGYIDTQGRPFELADLVLKRK